MAMNHIFAHRLSAMNSASAALSTTGSSDSSIAGIPTSRIPTLRSNVRIDLDRHYHSKVYNSGSPVSGTVSITTKRDVRFDSIQILLIGTTKTRVDGVSSPQEVSHTFLKMSMPIPESAYPVPRILESGQSLSIPFNFVIPPYLTINACNHHILSEHVRHQHVRLPPTLGYWEKDDLAPEMAQVEYAIKVRVFREPEIGPTVKVMEASREIRVLPTASEEPPLNPTKQDHLYTMSKSKSLKKNILSGKLGRLTTTAIEPPAVVLRPDGRGASRAVATVQLNFEPTCPEVAPPKVSGIASKVMAYTFYSSGAITSLPNRGEWSKQLGGEKRGTYTSSVSLGCFQPESNTWHQNVSGLRRDSGYSSDTPEAVSDSDSISVSDNERRPSRRHNARRPSKGAPVSYATSIQIPLTLPVDKKTFVPTFHSCIASRVYVLKLEIGLNCGTSSTTMSLAVPLQIIVEASNAQESLGDLPSFETAVGEAEADEYLRPRVLQVPEERFRETSQLPGYGDIRA